MFPEPRILTFRRNRNLYDLLRCKNIVDRKLQNVLQEEKKKDFPLNASKNQETTRNLLKAV